MDTRKRRWLFISLIAIVAVSVLLAVRPARQFHRFFLTACAANGPVRETELDIDPVPVDLVAYYAALNTHAANFDIREVARIEYSGERWPILVLGPKDATPRKRLLIVAGIHGNEVSGSLAAMDLIRTFASNPSAVAVYLLAPANPIGLKLGSRYDATGCDINRDFKAYRTPEARAIRSTIESLKPDLVLSLHEGPQTGAFVIGTKIAPVTLIERIVKDMEAARIPLASKNHLGMDLERPGFMIEGRFMTRAKSWLGINTLGEYTTSLGVPLVTTEAPWSMTKMPDRIAVHTIAVRAAIESLAASR